MSKAIIEFTLKGSEKIRTSERDYPTERFERLLEKELRNFAKYYDNVKVVSVTEYERTAYLIGYVRF